MTLLPDLDVETFTIAQEAFKTRDFEPLISHMERVRDERVEARIAAIQVAREESQ